jgi:hypothetical protein
MLFCVSIYSTVGIKICNYTHVCGLQFCLLKLNFMCTPSGTIVFIFYCFIVGNKIKYIDINKYKYRGKGVAPTIFFLFDSLTVVSSTNIKNYT